MLEILESSETKTTKVLDVFDYSVHGKELTGCLYTKEYSDNKHFKHPLYPLSFWKEDQTFGVNVKQHTRRKTFLDFICRGTRRYKKQCKEYSQLPEAGYINITWQGLQTSYWSLVYMIACDCLCPCYLTVASKQKKTENGVVESDWFFVVRLDDGGLLDVNLVMWDSILSKLGMPKKNRKTGPKYETISLGEKTKTLPSGRLITR